MEYKKNVVTVGKRHLRYPSQAQITPCPYRQVLTGTIEDNFSIEIRFLIRFSKHSCRCSFRKNHSCFHDQNEKKRATNKY